MKRLAALGLGLLLSTALTSCAGLAPGVRFKRLLELIRDAQLEGTIRTSDEALDFARRLDAAPP